MTDAMIEDMLTYWRSRCTDPLAERAASDVCQLAGEIDQQRTTANELADQSQRLRALAESRRVVLDKIREYADQTGTCAKDSHARFALGTIVNMVNQLEAEAGK